MSGYTKGEWKAVRDAQGICGLMHPNKPGVAVAWFSSSYDPEPSPTKETK